MLIGQLVSAASWPTNVSFSLTTLHPLLIGQLKLAVCWPTNASCSWAIHQLLIGQHNISSSLENWYQLFIGKLTSTFYWPNDLSCSLTNLHQLLIGQPMSAALWQTEMLIGKPNATNIKFNSKTLKLCLPRGNAAGRLLWVSCLIRVSWKMSYVFL